jgi:Putative DNA-binding domain
VEHCLARQEKELNIVKREQWTEEDLQNLPLGESDLFERKSARLFDDRNKFYDAVAKALSAFANSGGGSLILGVQDNSTPDGLPPREGDTPIRDWLEQKIPSLLDYPLTDFRVHKVIRSGESSIPSDKEVVVIDVGDSAAAPHQSSRDKTYYCREGGHSKPARHFYLELLRHRLTGPALVLDLRKIEFASARKYDNGIFLLLTLSFLVQNVGRVAAYEWQLIPQSMRWQSNHDHKQNRSGDIMFNNFPFVVPSAGINIARTILPGCVQMESKPIGFKLRPNSINKFSVREELQEIVIDLILYYRIATETSPGEQIALRLQEFMDVEAILGRTLESVELFG